MECTPAIASLAEMITNQLKDGRRVWYIGDEVTGAKDAAELYPTYGINTWGSIIAGGEAALTHAIQDAEKYPEAGWAQLQEAGIGKGDVVVGIGTNPYVLGALEASEANGVDTGHITCAPYEGAPDTRLMVSCDVGEEVLPGSRKEAATGLMLTTLSTTVMATGLRRVKDNKMVYMPVDGKNAKLLGRAIRMLEQFTGPIQNRAYAEQLLIKHGSVGKVLEFKSSSQKGSDQSPSE